MLSWPQRRKIAAFSIFFILVLSVAIFFILKVAGPASGMPPKAKDLSVLWTRFFEIRDGFADVAALIQNPNNFGAEKLTYSFKIYDKNNILIAIKEGQTFASALERFVVFEPNIPISERIPRRAVVDIKDIIFQVDQIDLRPKIDVLGTEKFLEDAFPRIIVNIKSREEKSLKNIKSTIVVFGENQNVLGVSSTQIPFLEIGEERTLTFTWPRVLSGASSVEVFFR